MIVFIILPIYSIKILQLFEKGNSYATALLALFQYVLQQTEIITSKDILILFLIHFVFQIIVGGLYGIEKGKMMLAFVHDQWE